MWRTADSIVTGESHFWGGIPVHDLIFQICPNFRRFAHFDAVFFPSDQRGDFKDWTNWLIRGHKNQAVGYCSASIQGEMIFLERAGIMWSHRGKGIHRESILHRIEWGRGQGAKQCLTYVDPENISSWSNLIKLGFHRFEPEWDWNGPEFWYFTKKL